MGQRTVAATLFLLTIGTGCRSHPPAAPQQAAHQAEKEIRELLDSQSRDWNNGNLEAFCAVYAPDAVFVSPNGVRRGRAEILARYKKRYQERGPQSMGQLRFDLVDVRVGPSADAVSVALKWFLTFDPELGKDDANGHALVVFRKKGNGWEMIQDASM